ncbi:hypothetical protein NK8_63180 (plasmid) [Caballeronia sp. NK8]|uniref:hypothetical protein n=1 Tax=Caballeronia sp. NK8 TaxID=140098 RepID=UPI001BB59423|nr:hypothetical protein [Caballeronia sp. NK8]BCQ28129.1 hypothetical protein NK8_63180 [Caballeronia sp. NK8]
MSNEERNQRLSSNIYHGVADAVVAYMVDCGLKDTDVISGEFLAALAHAYKPLPRFWRDFKFQPVVEAVSTQYPSWTSAVLRREQSATNVLRKVKKILKRNAFDEANAELLMTLPPTARPETAEDALEWICMKLSNEGLGDQLKCARLIGLDCGEQALEVVHCLEQAAAGVEYSSPFTQFVRQIRDQCIAKRRAVLTEA